ncbi:MAG TPA: nicotinate (nicotinamide) nucleotide adenylyltransferase [Spirochaetes bacterium]|nr:nicotinate (nicotinamide) nucleotide adenylyltransferase [Spirochaetota bacterium]
MKINCRNLGLFGGTFNPVHIGHLRLAEDIGEEFRLDKVVFIPTNIPPHKKMKEEISPVHRVRMVESAIKDNDRFTSDDIEVERGGISYTIETVNYVYDNYCFEEKPFFILGSDLLDEIAVWKDISILTRKVHFIVMMRAGSPGLDRLSGLADLFQTEDRDKQDGNYPACSNGLSFSLFEKRKLEITSSEIRERIKLKKSIRYLVTEDVLHYIERNDLYR